MKSNSKYIIYKSDKEVYKHLFDAKSDNKPKWKLIK